MVAGETDAERILDRLRPPVEEELEAVIGTRAEVSQLYRLMRYHLGWLDYDKGRGAFSPSSLKGGKRFRPALCLLSTKALGGEAERAVPAAAALELVHNFSLVFDDIQDNDRLRRFRPTIWALVGKERAINIGGGMHALVSAAALRLRGRGVPPETVLGVVDRLTRAVLELFEGQELDLIFEGREDVSVEEYVSMVGKKTAALVEASCACGAMLATTDRRKVERMARFGRSIGVAFQVQDDVLGIWKDPRKMGTPVGSDVRNRKKSLPVVHALAHASAKDRRLIREVYAKRRIGAQDVALVVGALERAGSRERSMEVAGEHADAAFRALDELGLAEDSELRALAGFLVKRDY